MPKAEAASNEAIMLINDNPGQETRIAIMRGSRLDDLLSERPATATSVGNIYRGRVTNVEAAIKPRLLTLVMAKLDFSTSPTCTRSTFPVKPRKRRSAKRPRVASVHRFKIA